MDISSAFLKMLSPVFHFFKLLIFFVSGSLFLVLLLFLIGFFIYCKVNPFRLSPVYLRSLTVKFFPYNLIRWLLVDFLTRKERKGLFKEYGFSIFCGRQGAGKTISMVDYLNRMHEKFPHCLIITNFQYAHSDGLLSDWRDLLNIRNGQLGVIFAIDEIHSEYSSDMWKDFPENLLSEISMQRKQRLKIIASSQAYSRVIKQIREQTFSVFQCETFFGRLTKYKEYDAAEYGTGDTPFLVKKRCKPIGKGMFVQSDSLRQCYDTYEKIERMKKIDFIPRKDRGY